LWGLLVANQCSAPRYWQPEEIDLLRQLATQAGIAIQQSELYEQTRHELCERQRMQTILAESEARFRNMADHAPVMIWVSDPTGSCSFLSQSWYEFTGQTEETGLGEGWLDAVHPDDRELVKTRFLTTNARQEAFQLDYRLRRHDGEYRWAVDTASPRIGADGQFQGYIGSVLDISDRKRAEAALRESQQRYMSLTEASPVGILCFDATGQCAYVNDRWSEMTGRPVEAARGSGWLRAIHPDDRDQTLLRWNQWLQAGEPVLAYRGEGRILRPDGRMVWFYCQILPEISSNGSLVGYIGSLTDISNRKQAELALQQQLQREQLITDISQDIRRSLSLNNVLSRTVERVRQVLNTDRVIIFRFRPNGQGKVISESVGATWIPILSTIIADPCFNDRCIEPFRQGHIATISDLDTAAIAPCHAELLQQFQVRANVVVPILQGETLWGFLIVHHCDAPRHWQPSEIDLLRQLATQVGIAIQQSELYEQTRHELRKRQQMQAILEASEERFRTLSAAAPIGICQTNADGICLYTNARWQQLSGFSFTDCLGNGWLRAIHPDDRPALLTAWDAYAQGASNYLPEFRLITPQGQIRWVSAQVAVMKSATDEIMGYVSTYEDITERKLAEQTIKEQAALLDIASDAIFVRDLNHRILYWNQGAEQLYGWTAAAAIGQLAPELLRNDPAQISGMMQTLLDAGDWRGELRKVTQAGKEVIVEARWTLVRDATGQPKSILSVDTDITQQKQLEAQFLRTQRLESLGTLASGIAHDMNNILTPVLAAAQLVPLKLPDLDEQSQRLLKILEDNAKRGALLVKQILTFARGLEGERLPVQVERILAELEPMLKSTFPKSITISVNVPTSKLWPVSADATQLHQVFMNLCVNARDAMPDGGTLQLSADNFVVDPSFAQLHLQAQVGAYVVITISDTGTGIPSDIQERIFDPFFTTKAVGKGTGLGLSTVLGIVKSHGGFVEVQSQPGVGSQFQIYLPAIAAVSPSTVSESDLPLGQGELILVVDDEENILQTAQTILETHNYRVLTARDGIDAIAGYAEHWRDIRLVIIDMMMPEMDGLSAVRALQHINPQVEVLAMSGLAGDYRQSAQALGIHTFLTKPFTTQELLQMIHTQLDND
jgi:PAS domain S-box-containing protein